MMNQTADHGESHERVFDIANPSEGIDFLGLLERCVDSEKELTALFDWRCPGCGTSNRDTALVQPLQGFLRSWVCRCCGSTTIVRFKARANSEWIAQHALAVTDNSGQYSADVSSVGGHSAGDNSKRKAPNQRLLAAIAIPSLLILIGLGLSDLRRVSNSSASYLRNWREPHPSTALSRLSGRWRSENGDDTLYFGPIDAAGQRGEYVYVRASDRSNQRFGFRVIHTDPRGEQLVLRQWQSRRGVAETEETSSQETWETTVYIPRRGRSLTWIDFRTGKPMLKVYRRMGN